MHKKQFVVLGMGKFGSSVATTLADCGCEVLVIDDDEERINEVADKVTYAVRADVTDPEALKSLGISNFDGAIIGMGESLEASVLATILIKEMGVPYVLAKAQTEIHAKILKKVGADKIVFPEKETGIRIANNLLMNNLFDAIELSSVYSMMELEAFPEWYGKTLKELDLRAIYKINVIGIKKHDNLNINPEPDQLISEDDILIIIGENEVLDELASKL